ncbi:hypothetical protein HaloA020_29280 [Halomonas sp. A020]|uniref:hypothetical protein n=1 Tax=Halomonas sp. A020 TaxID=2717374 RepID=UPI002491176F|nr:hypothetical protein [Halomonas sp. A020]BCB62227.1 hypothetical protein HaloA020_29280 [Halomonas sp. A020]
MDDHVYRYAMANSRGEILQVTSGPYLYVPCDDAVSDASHYVDTASGSVKHKKMLQFEKLVEGMTVVLTGLPVGLKVSTNNVSTLTDSQPLSITYDVPGTYQISFNGRFDYLDCIEDVTVGNA